MKKKLVKSVLSIYLFALSFFAYSQTGGVSINKNNTPADPSAMLDVSSTSSPYLGMLIPRMSTVNRNSITSPATGLMIYNTDCGINEYYTGTCWVSTGQNLKAPSPIACSGTTDFCANETRTFTIPAVTGATNYAWTVPPGAVITSGQGTNSVIVAFGNHSGDVCVTAENLCETSQSRCIGLYVNPVPPTPGNITGPTFVAPGTSATYFIASVTGAGVYNWTVPSGATITSGVGTTTIAISFACNAVSGNISVNAQSNCGTSSASTLAVTLNSVSASAGPDIISPSTLGGSPTASGGTSPYTYAWVPSTNLSSTTVANPSTTVCTTTTYTITVTDANGCAASSSVIASIVSPLPATPGSITGSTSASCYSSGNVYSIAAVTNATTYSWTVPSGANITAGQGTTSITVTFAGNSGNISVTAGNGCGTSSANSLSVTVSGGGSGSQTFNYTGSQQTFTVPSCITQVTIQAYGAQGAAGGSGGCTSGLGGYATGILTASSGSILYVNVGGQNGYNGGASGGSNSGGGAGGVGGGASDVRLGNTALSDRKIVAGGGGGAGATGAYSGSPCCGAGGAGGGGGGFGGGGGSSNGTGGTSIKGGDGGSTGGSCTGGNGGGGGGNGGGGGAGGNGGTPGTGGTGSSGADGGVGNAGGGGGALGNGGYGGTSYSSNYGNGGGGGGGWWGGGGGGCWGHAGGGGGGSNYTGGVTGSSESSGVRTGNGQIIINW